MPPIVLPEPVNEMVLLPAVNAEAELLFAQLPATLIIVAVPAAKVPDVSVRSPFKVKVVVLPPTLSVCADLATVRLLNVWLVAKPLMA